jgi:hypothetical protein
MGERRLGEQPIQESWDLALGTHQRALIELGYEGISIEQVTEQRLRRAAYGPRATTAAVLEAVENATLYLRNRRLADELGSRALEVLSAERSVDGAPQVLRRARRLLAYYRTSEPVLLWAARTQLGQLSREDLGPAVAGPAGAGRRTCGTGPGCGPGSRAARRLPRDG